MNDLTIRDLENLSGIKAHTIRMWEQRYGFLKPQRTDTNIRYYSNDELKTILNVALLNKYGFKLCHIDQMKPSEICEKVLSLTGTEAAHERIINELIREMMDMRAEEFETILNKHINENGLEASIKDVIFPFLERIGLLWQTGHILAAQEHFVRSIIRQKLIVAIDTIVPAQQSGKKILLFLPEKESQELGLLFLYYLLKLRGVKVTYLGANVPLSDVAHVAGKLKPDMAFIHFTNPCLRFENLTQDISKYLNKLPIIISGCPTYACCKQVPSNISFQKSFQEVMEFISTI